jgi:hypothetical protein
MLQAVGVDSKVQVMTPAQEVACSFGNVCWLWPTLASTYSIALLG